MSFADELKKMPEERKRQDELKLETEIKEYCDKCYDRFKKLCKDWASSGSNSYDNTLFSLNGYFFDKEEQNRFNNYLSEKDADFFEKYIGDKLSKEGFESYEIKRLPHQQYRTEYKFVEYSPGEKLLGGLMGALTSDIGDKNGYKKKIRVNDGFRYDIKISVKW